MINEVGAALGSAAAEGNEGLRCSHATGRAGPVLPTLTTPRFRLRPLTGIDESFYVSIYSNPQLMRFVGEPMTHRAATAAFRAFLKSNERGNLHQACCWVVEDHQDTAERAGLLALLPHTAAAEIGVMVTACWQGRKVAQETIGFLSSYLFLHTSWSRTFSRHTRANEAGAGVMRRLGFHEMEDVPGGDAFRGWEITRSEWLLRVREDNRFNP